MSAKTKIDYLYYLMREEKRPYFFINDEKGNLLRAQSESDDVERSIEEIKRFLENNEGIFTISARKQAKPNNQYDKALTYTISNSFLANDLKNNPPVASGINGFGVPPSPSQIYGFDPLQKIFEQNAEISRLQGLLAQEQVNNRIKQLEDKLEGKNSDAEFQKTIAGIVGPMFMGSMGSGQGSKVAINGFGDDPLTDANPTQTHTSERNARINRAVIKLISLDPDFATNIEKLASLAEKNPAIYKMAVSHLNSL